MATCTPRARLRRPHSRRRLAVPAAASVCRCSAVCVPSLSTAVHIFLCPSSCCRRRCSDPRRRPPHWSPRAPCRPQPRPASPSRDAPPAAERTAAAPTNTDCTDTSSRSSQVTRCERRGDTRRAASSAGQSRRGSAPGEAAIDSADRSVRSPLRSVCFPVCSCVLTAPEVIPPWDKYSMTERTSRQQTSVHARPSDSHRIGGRSPLRCVALSVCPCVSSS